MKKISFGKFNGREAYIYQLETEYFKAGIADLGASLQYVKVKCGDKWTDICPGFDDAQKYIDSNSYLGATVGRVANRIKGGSFVLEGKRYTLPQNDVTNCHHGGPLGYDKKFFIANPCGNMLELTLFSPDGDMGFPGDLSLKVQYIADGHSLIINYFAMSDKTTLWAPTCHTYFNLEGVRGDASLKGNMLRIYSQRYTPIGEGMVPTGEIASVVGTPFDFSETFRDITERIGEKNAQLELAGGYDHNYVLEGEHAASAYGRDSGIALDIYTDMPGLQLYSGNFLGGNAACGVLQPRSAFALEAQFFPNSANIPSFPQPVLHAGEHKQYYIRYEFGCKEQGK